MGIIEQIENEYRQKKNYGVQFSIKPDAYDCKVGNRIYFGENETVLQCGCFYNYQNIIFDGVIVGYLQEIDCGKLFDPITSSFIIPIADCSEEEIWNEMLKKYGNNPHLFDNDEVLELRFATLNQLVDFLGIA